MAREAVARNTPEQRAELWDSCWRGDLFNAMRNLDASGGDHAVEFGDRIELPFPSRTVECSRQKTDSRQALYSVAIRAKRTSTARNQGSAAASFLGGAPAASNASTSSHAAPWPPARSPPSAHAPHSVIFTNPCWTSCVVLAMASVLTLMSGSRSLFPQPWAFAVAPQSSTFTPRFCRSEMRSL